MSLGGIEVKFWENPLVYYRESNDQLEYQHFKKNFY